MRMYCFYRIFRYPPRLGLRYQPQHSRLAHPIEQLRKENAAAWSLVWQLAGLCTVLAMLSGAVIGILIIHLT